MRQRNKPGGKAAKTHRRRTGAPRTTAKIAHHRKSSSVDTAERIALLEHRLNEALEQQTATSEVLKVISSSPGELKPVFDALLANAVRICDAKFGALFLMEGDAFRYVALHGAPPAFAETRRREPITRAKPGTTIGRVAATKKPAQTADIRAEPAYTSDPERIPILELAGARTILGVPMLKESQLVGIIVIYRQEVRPFTDKQIDLLSNFAAQAVIAIENTRLLNELRESLQQQTATADVLKVISSSPGELEPVFNAMLENAITLCEASYGNMWLCEGEDFRTAARHGPLPPAFLEKWRNGTLFRLGPEVPLVRAAKTGQSVQVADLRADQAYLDGDPLAVSGADEAGMRTLVAVPMLKENRPVGVIVIYRKEVRPFTDKQIELVKNFAAQAVIAIENARLLNELRESLQQQTATSDVLKVISSSPGELNAVFEAMLENAVRICGATFGNLWLREGDGFRVGATHGAPTAYVDYLRSQDVFHPDPRAGLGQVLRTKEAFQVADVAAAPTHGDKRRQALIELAGARTLINVPMLKDNEVVGAIGIYRQEVRPFTDKQIELVKNFAAQAVIAIENTRLLNDLNDLNQQLELRVADQVNEIERMGKLRRFLPPQVADLIVASGAEKQLESHRREITALFCDLRGFTGFSESSDPEDVMALLREYHAAIGEIINKYGGTLERYAGDGVMVVFNDPIPVDNPALQAVLMAIDMRAAIEQLIGKWRKLGHDIGFGIGVAHGFATLGTIGFEGRFDYAAIGTVSNVASRLCDEAKPGQILISPRVLMAVEGAISVEPVGEFKLKGISRPLATYNVLSAVSAKI
jgi:GAF domain-containing protein